MALGDGQYLSVPHSLPGRRVAGLHRRRGAKPLGVPTETPRTATLLRLFVGEQERYGHQPLYEAIVIKAREHGLAGATNLATTRRWHARI